MTGFMFIANPSAGIDTGPGVYAKPVGGVGPIAFGPTTGAKTVSAVGTTTSTFVGRSVVVASNVLNHSGMLLRVFPAFANVGGLTKTWMDFQQQATFAEGLGALAAGCPGPGCTSSGAGTVISWCPPLLHDPGDPAPGTAGAPVGNWDCPSWPAGAGGGDRFIRFALSNASGRANFGGTISILRNLVQNVWRVPVQPSTPNAGDAQVTRSFRNETTMGWAPGGPNFNFVPVLGNNGPRLFARLDASGAVQSTFGCTNGVGTPGGSFMRGFPIPGVGSNCGTDPQPDVPGTLWGFRLTTGTLSGSDPYPFGLVVTTLAGTPFNPSFGTQPATQGFFFSRMGDDSVTGTGPNAVRNIVLLGGAVGADPDSGNAYFQTMDIKLTLSVPEPAAGLAALAALALRRR